VADREAWHEEAYAVELRSLDYARRLEDQAYENQLAQIEARYGPAQN
jgi:hypothetical protein